MNSRRGSPLLIGVKSRNKLSTDHIPVLYSKGVYNQQLLNSDIISRKVENCGIISIFMRDLLYNGNPIALGMAKIIVLAIPSARKLKVAITRCPDFLIQ